MRLVPLGDRVVLKQLVAEETTKSGIVLPAFSEGKALFSRRCREMAWYFWKWMEIR